MMGLEQINYQNELIARERKIDRLEAELKELKQNDTKRNLKAV